MQFDIQNKALKLLQRMGLALALAAGCGIASASVIHVSIDTSTFGVASGYIDMEFSATGGPLATAAVSKLVGLAATPDIQWGVEQAAWGYTFRNDTVNLLSHAASFGGIVSFDLAITGDYDPAGSIVSAFKVAAFDGANYLGNFDPATGALATFLWTPSPSVTGNDSLALNVSDSSVAVVPEPFSLLLMAVGLAAMVLALRQRGRAAAARGGELIVLAA
ncbi:NF038129 family PEP-CTERM protein [Pseudoduganella sp. LjRoot289]|uniref:NF038129 family PEP-CTERM protein n=1 Tax=Pseudoduganella sp. LjRoot289 TaxID=3342314 RepID=UPI003ECF3C58